MRRLLFHGADVPMGSHQPDSLDGPAAEPVLPLGAGGSRRGACWARCRGGSFAEDADRLTSIWDRLILWIGTWKPLRRSAIKMPP